MNYMFNSKMSEVKKKGIGSFLFLFFNKFDVMSFLNIDKIVVYIHIPMLIILEAFYMYKRLHIKKVKQLLYYDTTMIINTLRIRQQSLLSYLLLSVQIVLLI